ncbi:uncharacterized protein LOC119184355 isoform X3 [Rhipicephalus microplus]|uniref:uncharacterized protein LOC119184355 isoform X3 n=1 Tax=Rhipicephalus microplus TaxID=6941 RepID=UPI003F6AE5F4
MEHCDNTSNDDIIQKAKSAKAAAIVVTYNEKQPIVETSTDIKKLDIVVAFAKNSTGRQIAHYEEKHANGTVMAKLFTRSTALDWSFAIIWLIAVGTVTLGAYWSGIAQCGRYGIAVYSVLLTRPSTFSVDVRYKQKVAQPVRTRSRPKRISRRLRRPSEPDRKPALPGHHVRHGIRSCTDFLSGATRQPHQRREIEGASTDGSVLSDAHGSQACGPSGVWHVCGRHLVLAAPQRDVWLDPSGSARCRLLRQHAQKHPPAQPQAPLLTLDAPAGVRRLLRLHYAFLAREPRKRDGRSGQRFRGQRGPANGDQVPQDLPEWLL